MKNTSILLLCLIVCLVYSGRSQEMPAAYNVVWDSPSANSSESMPLGGGDIGCNVWVEDGQIYLYVQRSGSLAETNQYLKLGRLNITLNPNPFIEDKNSLEFRQELMLQEGYIEITGKRKIGKSTLEAKVKLWVDVFNPVVHMEVEASHEVVVDAAYEYWRFKDQIIHDNGMRHSTFTLDAYPGEVVQQKDSVIQDAKGITFLHQNPDSKLVPDMLIVQQGLEDYKNRIRDDLKGRIFGGQLYGDDFQSALESNGKYMGVPYKGKHILSGKSTHHHLKLASHISQGQTLDEWKEELADIIVRSKNTDQNATKTWWEDFWSRSYIHVNPDHRNEKDSVWKISRNYQLFRYQLGGNVFGEYPTKFNGGNLTFDAGLVNKDRDFGPDFRAWGGGVFTAQNQRLIYWPLLKSGDFDAILPHFELYHKALPGARARVKASFGHDGALYSEYIGVPGISLGAGYGWSEGRRKRGEEVPFGDERVNGFRGYNDFVERGVMANPSIAYHWESQIENAYMILEYHQFTGADISRYMPFIEESIVFFDEHYRMREKIRSGQELDQNGKLVIFPSTSCESYRGAKNPSDVIAGLNACLKSLLELDGKFLTLNDKAYYREMLSRIPDYPFGNQEGKDIIKPAEEWLRESNVELPQFYPLFPFNQYKLGDEEIPTFINSYRLAPDFRKGMVISWHQDGIFFARMGMTNEAMSYNYQKLKDSERRFPTFWGPGHDWVPDHNWGGSGMIGLQEMLMQTIGDEILLFPAWPKEWDVSFKLHAPKNTTVEVVLEDGEIKNLIIFPEERRKDLRILNFQ